MDLRISGSSTVSSVMTGAGDFGAAGTSNADSEAVSDSIGCGYDGTPVSSISTTCGASCPSSSTPGSSTLPSGSIYGSSTSLAHGYSPSDSEPTPGIYTYPMRRPYLSVKVNCLG